VMKEAVAMAVSAASGNVVLVGIAESTIVRFRIRPGSNLHSGVRVKLR
jgi:hypothetical protein